MSLKKQYITVTQLLNFIKKILTDSIPTVNFEGEISSLKTSINGHCYLDIKDESSTASCVIWASRFSRLNFKPKAGMKVLCQGTPDVYPQRGSLQIQILNMIPAGEGDLMLKFIELREKLAGEGLFDVSRKRPIPFLPKTIGIITSQEGSVISDMKVKLEERMPSVKVLLYPSAVQGKGACLQLVKGIEYFNSKQNVDVIIIARGGGSLEDLWEFNEEVLVRAIFASKIPVVSGVGHEPDITLCDLVADLRAPTPTAAAEAVVPKREDLIQSLIKLEKRLSNFQNWFYPFAQRLDELDGAFKKSFINYFQQKREKFKTADRLLKLLNPEVVIKNAKQKIFHFYNRLSSVYSKEIKHREIIVSNQNQLFRNCQKQFFLNQNILFNNFAKRLESINPINILNRGYAIIKKDNLIITDSSKLKKREELQINFAKSEIEVIVK